MENSNEYLLRKKEEYIEKLTPLFAYIPYLQSKEGENTRSVYEDENLKSVPVPVYDSTVLAFVKACQASELMNRNYMYSLNRIRANTAKDVRLFLVGSGFTDIDTIIDIISKYVLKGMTKGAYWSDAVQEGIWLHCLLKLKELLEIYDRPLA